MAYFGADQIFDFENSLPDQSFELPFELPFELYGEVPALEDPALEPIHSLGQLPSSDNYMLHSFNSSPLPNPSTSTGEQAPSDAQNVVITSMGPPSKPRKPKAPTLRADDWEPYKARIIELHIEQNVPLPKVRDIIEQEFNFKAEYVQSLM
jgi:hypothetical protein